MIEYREYILGEAAAPPKPQKGDVVMAAGEGVGLIAKLTNSLAYVDIEGQQIPISIEDLSLQKISARSLAWYPRDGATNIVWKEE